MFAICQKNRACVGIGHVHMADPVLEELTAMSERLEQLEEELYRLKNRKGMKGRPA